MPGLLRVAVDAALGLLRWSQLAPMITLWAFGIGMLLAMLLVNNQEAAWDLVGASLRWVAGVPVIGDAFLAKLDALADDDGRIRIDGRDVEAFALGAWGILTLAFMGIAALASRIFGPFEPWTLGRKLGIAALASIILCLAFIAVYWSDAEQFNGPASDWMFMFSGVALLLFVVSTWCVSIAHALGLVQDAIASSPAGDRH